MPHEGGLRIRPAARAILLTPDAEVLLVRFEFPAGTRWALPGGGLESGETAAEALRRELREEVGPREVAIGPLVWAREHIIPFLDGRWDGQREDIHLVPVEHFDPKPELSWDQLRNEYLHEVRWWTLDQIEAATSAEPTLFAPRALGVHLRNLVTDGPSERPVEVGV